DPREHGRQLREADGPSRSLLVETVHRYDRHLFLCYESPEVWDGAGAVLAIWMVAAAIGRWREMGLVACQFEKPEISLKSGELCLKEV
ncbi:hypothetical protein GW17_00031916, partial [Ensete ventricosum]